MNFTKYGYIIIGLLSISCHSNPKAAANEEAPIPPNMLLINNAIFIECAVNDSIKGLFFLDNGSYQLNLSKDFCLEHALIDSINPTLLNNRGKSIGAFQNRNVSIQFENTGFTYPNFINLDYEKIGLCGVAGIVGIELFEEKITTLDFFNKKISFLDTINFSLDDYAKLPITRTTKSGEKVFYCTVPVKMWYKNTEIALDLLVDLGSYKGITLKNKFSRHFVNTDSKSNYSRMSDGLIKADEYSVDSIKLGSCVLPMAKASIPNQSPVDGLPLGDGLLGMDVLKNFDLVMDLKNNYLYVKPGGLYNLPQKDRTSGFKYYSACSDSEIRGLVLDVDETSDAYKQGVRKGDKVIEINDKPLDYYASILRFEEQRTNPRKFLIKRNDTTFRVTIYDPE